jgi:hypothetical protein
MQRASITLTASSTIASGATEMTLRVTAWATIIDFLRYGGMGKPRREVIPRS